MYICIYTYEIDNWQDNGEECGCVVTTMRRKQATRSNM